MKQDFVKEEIEQSISHRFEGIARRYAEQPAVKTTSDTLSYDALNKAANRVARVLLIRRGEGEEPIPLLLEYDTLLLVALLGVLKAGKAYVVLDPSFPKARLTAILEDLQTDVIVTNCNNLGLTKELALDTYQVMNLDRLDANLSEQNLDLSIPPETLAGIFYTSGSTGKPKGVERNQRNVLHHIWMETHYCKLGPADNISLLYSCSFSASMTDIFGALLNGATLCLYNVKTHGITPLSEWLRQKEISLLHLPVTLFRQLLDTLTKGENFPKLRQIAPSGQFFKRDVERLRKHFSPDCVVIQRFSSTETSMIARFVLDKQTVVISNVVPVGYAVEDKEILILDDETGASIGCNRIGEIAVKSYYLSPGYWRKPELTQKVFSPDPQGSGKRIYRMGDLGRMRSDGCLEFLGRKDFQVKIRGYRVEIAEIEAALYQLDSVKEAVVTTDEQKSGGAQLLAYVVPSGQPAPTVDKLRRILAETLPDYMIPTRFVFMETFLLTSTGKIDRQALPKPEHTRPSLETAFAPPGNYKEEVVAAIWAEVLGLEQVGIYDNFFDLGGHSLNATRIVSRIFENLQVDVSLQDFWNTLTIAGLAEIIQHKQIESFSEQQTSGTFQPIPRRNTSGSYSPSFAQQRLWFLHQLEPTVPMYNMPRAWNIQGELNVQALWQALDYLIERHETLRTTFTTVNGEPLATILPRWTFDVPIHDLSHWPEAQRESEAQRLIQQEVRRPFDLAHDLMLRGTLFRIHDTEHILLLVKHHIATDAWSSGILHRELGVLYDGFAQGHAATLPDLPVQYADFAVWQRECLQGEQLHTLLTYWKQQLAQVPRLELPTDHPRPAVQTYRSASQSLRLSEGLCDAITILSRKEGVSVFMTLLAAFTVLLSRYTGQIDIAIGAPVANRRRPELEGFVGIFVNTLVLRIDLSGNPSFRELLQRVKTITLEAHEHQDLPFEQLVEELQVERSLHMHPLFQVLFDFVNTPSAEVHLSGVTLKSLPVARNSSGFDLIWYIKGKGENLKVGCTYATEVFETSTIKRLLRHFQVLLKAIVAHPTQRISELPLLTQTERHQILVEWNATQTDYPRDACIHQLFEAQVERTPDAIAVVFEGRQLTYRQLNSRANQLAHYLKKLGVGPEVLVSLCVERSLEMIIGLLGILKAGGTYVPLSPVYPTTRLVCMLSDPQVTILLTQEGLLPDLPDHQARLICLDKDWQIIAQENDTNPNTRVRPENLAYVIYTSGSTGIPKGVLVPHKGLLNLIFWHVQAFAVTSSDRATQLAGTAFDASVWEIWPYLTIGASLYLAPPDVLISPEELKNWLVSEGITISFVPTPLAEEVLSLEWHAEGKLRTLLTGSDKLHRYPPGTSPFTLVNNYGPTENTVVTTSGVVAVNGRDMSAPPIGRPINNTQVYALDQYLQPVPIGVPGEIHIGGNSLARGYLNHPELTAERFIPNPFADGCHRQTRIYKTGDLARYLPDGNIEFLGRLDHQVKIRGFRIELGGIETVLNQHPSIREAVVLIREDTPEMKRLVAYVVSLQESTPTTSRLREFLTQRLPEYMIPSAFMFLDALPLTPTGKIDRKALPEPEHTRPDLEERCVPPRTPFEKKLVQIWCEILQFEQVGIHDNFFALGGHSLLATQIISRINRAFGIEVPLRLLFETPTVAGLAARVAQIRLKTETSETLEQLIGKIEQFSDEEMKQHLLETGG